MLLIVYGSLYPWRFTVPHLDASPFVVLLHAWPSLALRYSVRDVIVNIALYIPLGFTAHIVFRRTIFAPVLVGLLLSTTMELLQLLVPGRSTSMVDLITNVIGTALGVALGTLFSSRIFDWKTADRAALTLAFCWTAWLVFPLFPALSTHVLAAKLSTFAHSSPFDLRTLVSSAAAWYAGGLLITAAGMPVTRRWFAITLAAVPIQFLIVDKQPTQAFLIGSLAGVILFLVFAFAPPSRRDAWLFLAVIVLRGLAPFHFTTASTPFAWTPFGATLDSEWQSAGVILIEKIFYYGTAIWLLRTVSVKRAVWIVAATLAAIELLQTHLPGRTPEITDPLLALLLGFVLWTLSRSPVDRQHLRDQRPADRLRFARDDS